VAAVWTVRENSAEPADRLANCPVSSAPHTSRRLIFIEHSPDLPGFLAVPNAPQRISIPCIFHSFQECQLEFTEAGRPESGKSERPSKVSSNWRVGKIPCRQNINGLKTRAVFPDMHPSLAARKGAIISLTTDRSLTTKKEWLS
jgi:hypothetical protein